MKTKLEDFLNEKEEYVGAHSAPTKDDSPLYDLTNVFGDDIYSSNAARYFTSGDDIVDIESLRVIKAARNRPNYPVKIYRAVPDLNYDINKKISNIRYIINYYDKFRFFPLKNEIVNALQDKYENLKYDDQIKIIIDELYKMRNELSENLVKLTINDGDWVTLSLTYAKLHGENNLKKFKILSKTVKASQLYNDGYIAEFGYNK